MSAISTAAPARGSELPNAGQEPFLRRPRAAAACALAAAATDLVAYGGTAEGALAAGVGVVLVVVAATDLERRIIPNRIVVPATLLVLLARMAITPSRSIEVLVAAAGGAVVFLIPNLISPSLMGMGDVKLVAFIGAALGWGVIGAVALASFAMLPFALGRIVRGGLKARKSTLPFGPFLAFGALAVMVVPHLLGLGGG